MIEKASAPRVPVRDAATVVLLRDGDSGIEAWLLTRVTQMAFAAGMSVFPGGRVDVADADVAWSGRPAAEFAARFGCDERLARSLVAAAVRETFEETGVLLSSPVADLTTSRAAVEAGELAFAALLDEHRLALDADAVRPWTRWITPEGEVRRYDTRFFVAALPDGAEAQDVTSESSVAGWLSIATALDEAARGARLMLPPTRLTLASLTPFATVTDILAAADGRNLDPIQPVLRHDADGVHIVLPDGTSVPMPRGRLA